MIDLNPSFLASARFQPNLYSTLRQFAQFGSAETNYADFWIDNEQSTARLLSAFSASNDPKDIRTSE